MDTKFSDRDFFIIQTAWRRLNAKQYDAAEGWRRFHGTVRSGRRKMYKYPGIAAAVLLLITIGYWGWQKIDNTEKAVAVSEILRARGLPVLTLGNGKQVTLNAQKSETLIRQSGGIILVHDSLLSLQYLNTDQSSDNTEPIYNTLYIPKGGEYSLILADGSKVWLNSETTLRYPVNLGRGKRIVELEGEAYFEVAPDSLRPFSVRMDDRVVEVLGTHFNVSHYKTDSVWHTTLVEGKVQICRSGHQYVLIPGTQYRENIITGQTQVAKVDVRTYTSWKDGKVIFQNERLEDIIRKLARWYDFEIFYANPVAKDLHFGGAINKYNAFEVVLRYLEQTAGVRFDIRGKTVIANLTE